MAADFEIGQPDLLAALACVLRSTGKGGAEVLKNVWIRASPCDRLLLSTTDLIIGHTEFVRAKVRGSGALLISAKKLHTLVKSMPRQTLRVQGESDHRIRISASDISLRLDAADPGEFPELPPFDGVLFTEVSAPTLVEMINKVLFSVSRDEHRINLTGALFECDGAQGTMVSTDGCRLTKYSAPLTGPELQRGINIPRGGLIELTKALKKVKGDVGLGADDTHLFVRTKSLHLSIKLTHATFPPYRMIIPSGDAHRALVRRDPMIGALKRSLVLDAHVNVTRMHFTCDHLKIVTLDPDGGTMEQELDIEYAGADMLVGCNAQYLSEVLEQITTDTAYMDLREPTSAGPSPMVIRPADDTDYLCVVMPVRLSENTP